MVDIPSNSPYAAAAAVVDELKRSLAGIYISKQMVPRFGTNPGFLAIERMCTAGEEEKMNTNQALVIKAILVRRPQGMFRAIIRIRPFELSGSPRILQMVRSAIDLYPNEVIIHQESWNDRRQRLGWEPLEWHQVVYPENGFYIRPPL